MKASKNSKSDGGPFSFMDENPELANIGMGLLKSLQEENRAKAYMPAEIAKTQYGYLTGAGTGDPSKYKSNSYVDRMMQGYITGADQRRDQEFSKKILDLLKKKDKTPSRAPADTIASAGGNPANPVTIQPEAQAKPIAEQAAESAQAFTMGASGLMDPEVRNDFLLQEMMKDSFKDSYESPEQRKRRLMRESANPRGY